MLWIFWSVCQFLSLLLPLLVVAFFTLFQRKILGLTAVRLGVNKVSFLGIFQPLLDAVKLLKKKMLSPEKANFFFFFASPLLLFWLSLGFWSSFSFWSTSSALLGMLMILILMGLSTFAFFGISWFSGAKYPSASVLRASALSVSLEACFGLFLFFLIFWKKKMEVSIFKLVFFLLFFGFWIFLSLMETMTSPFDLVEAESELVSGFNTEFGGTLFIFLFLSEYLMKMFLACLTSLLFFSGTKIMMGFFFFLFLVCQTTFLRMKSEWMMGFVWLKLLPLLLSGYFFGFWMAS